jgi:hypothetical protein
VDLVVVRGSGRGPRPDLEALSAEELVALSFSAGGARVALVDDPSLVGGANVTRAMAIAALDERFLPREQLLSEAAGSSTSSSSEAAAAADSAAADASGLDESCAADDVTVIIHETPERLAAEDASSHAAAATASDPLASIEQFSLDEFSDDFDDFDDESSVASGASVVIADMQMTDLEPSAVSADAAPSSPERHRTIKFCADEEIEEFDTYTKADYDRVLDAGDYGGLGELFEANSEAKDAEADAEAAGSIRGLQWHAVRLERKNRRGYK